MKNIKKEFAVYKAARQSEGETEVQDTGIGSRMTSLTFQSMLSNAEIRHILAKESLMNIFKETTKKSPNYSNLPGLLTKIAYSKSEARKLYEELLILYSRNSMVFRNLAILMRDMFMHDDDAEILFQTC
ncbi:MAG: hypothetical protein EZS28_001472 [Streblomastix strix]|uniref:Uncharacterized protein n=1 Tax=Streblomastix strix TaxID=222440 RepID=A0A5J4X8V1_9EUKA|nr:MAG: hypothetical protein EZS28_001472 [Streblomastix strix]